MSLPKQLLGLIAFASSSVLSAQTLDLKKGQDGNYIHLRSLDYQTEKASKPAAPRPEVSEDTPQISAQPLASPSVSPEIEPRKPKPPQVLSSDKLPRVMLGLQYVFTDQPLEAREHQLVGEFLFSPRSTLGFHAGQTELRNSQVLDRLTAKQFGLQYRSYPFYPLYLEASLSLAQGDFSDTQQRQQGLEFFWVDLALGLKIRVGSFYGDLRLANLRQYQSRDEIQDPQRTMLGPAAFGLGFSF